MAYARLSPDYEHAYNAVMAELRRYIRGSECRVDEILEILSALPSESVNSLLVQLRRNLEAWHYMGTITDEQYSRGLSKLEEIERLSKR